MPLPGRMSQQRLIFEVGEIPRLIQRVRSRIRGQAKQPKLITVKSKKSSRLLLSSNRVSVGLTQTIITADLPTVSTAHKNSQAVVLNNVVANHPIAITPGGEHAH